MNPRRLWRFVMRSIIPRFLMDGDIEEGDPVLGRLEGEADEDQADAEDAHASLREMVGGPLDEGTEGAGDGGDESDDESGFDADGDGVGPVVREEAADVAADGVADGAIRRGEELEARDARSS